MGCSATCLFYELMNSAMIVVSNMLLVHDTQNRFQMDCNSYLESALTLKMMDLPKLTQDSVLTAAVLIKE